MINVTIGGMTVPAEKASEGWVNQMIVEARKQGAQPCVRVNVDTPDAQLALSPPGCGGGFGGGRLPNQREKRILDAWNRRGMATGQFSPGEFRAFLNDLARLL
jgi:hypothetical protein